jgi:hypothetical protein
MVISMCVGGFERDPESFHVHIIFVATDDKIDL